MRLPILLLGFVHVHVVNWIRPSVNVQQKAGPKATYRRSPA
jgi:hypothetical protein